MVSRCGFPTSWTELTTEPPKRYTTVWSQPFAESVNFADGTNGTVSTGTDYEVAKTVNLSETHKQSGELSIHYGHDTITG